MTNATPDKITFRPGSLSGRLFAWCKEHDTTPSEAIRVALARMLKVEPPAMPVGRPERPDKQRD